MSILLKMVEVEITGISPLLMQAFHLKPPKDCCATIGYTNKAANKKAAESVAYRNSKGRLYIPALCVRAALIDAGVFIRVGTTGRVSLQKPMAACIAVAPDELDLGITKYKVHTIPVGWGQVNTFYWHRPRIDEWSLTFSIEYDYSLVTTTQLRKALALAGSRVGLLATRPKRGGSFGRFKVTKWKVVKKKQAVLSAV